MNLPIEVFTEWANEGRDEAMAKGHLGSVNAMLDFVLNDQLEPFSFIDAGCGNGWVVKKVSNNPLCTSSLGVDGSKSMIQKAISNDPHNIYKCADLTEWEPKEKVDLIHSMEVFYYVVDPISLIKRVVDNWLKPAGKLIIGVDFYKENEVSKSWPNDCGISIMSRLSESEWIQGFKNAGLQNISSWREGVKDNWAGTLIITGQK